MLHEQRWKKDQIKEKLKGPRPRVSSVFDLDVLLEASFTSTMDVARLAVRRLSGPHIYIYFSPLLLVREEDATLC